MRYRVQLKQLHDGVFYARCHAAPYGLAETHGDTSDEALDKMRQKIRYRLEWCPCSGIAEDFVELDVRDMSRIGGVREACPHSPGRR